MPNVTVTLTPSNPAGRQITCSPGTVHVPYGNGQTVTWTLVSPQGATFAANGISFKNGTPGTLTRNSDTEYTLTDDNTNTSGQEVDYAYGVNLLYQGTPYSEDPEVANDPQGGGGGGALRYHSA